MSAWLKCNKGTILNATKIIVIRTENGFIFSTITHGKSYDVPKIDDIYIVLLTIDLNSSNVNL